MHMGGRMAHENICPATKGNGIDADFSDEEKIASTTSPNVKTASGVISVEDDDINENPQVFFLLAEVTLDSHLPLTKVCFKKHEKDTNCTGNGTALVRILDNDPMYIGFTMRSDSVIESEGTRVIEISSNIMSERTIQSRLT
ncbi:hypothetical protein GBAR_LOCUS5721 [Geodia barretti]|uniref:Uncharacterized protein n=1 Tax=Geodia barretti TaxID=519541 RepID=A0AA35W5Q7_GEOBA|nr:hypothetical protein GBAR_LOCUS5721 [Geodia barretti]